MGHADSQCKPPQFAVEFAESGWFVRHRDRGAIVEVPAYDEAVEIARALNEGTSLSLYCALSDSQGSIFYRDVFDAIREYELMIETFPRAYISLHVGPAYGPAVRQHFPARYGS